MIVAENVSTKAMVRAGFRFFYGADGSYSIVPPGTKNALFTTGTHANRQAAWDTVRAWVILSWQDLCEDFPGILKAGGNEA